MILLLIPDSTILPLDLKLHNRIRVNRNNNDGHTTEL